MPVLSSRKDVSAGVNTQQPETGPSALGRGGHGVLWPLREPADQRVTDDGLTDWYSLRLIEVAG